MSAQQLTPLGSYLRQQIASKRRAGDRSWSQNELARRAGLSSGTISMIMNGVVAPEATTLRKIADALEIDVSPLLEKAGILEPTESLNPTALYIAQRLSSLPQWLQEEAIDGIGAMVDQLWAIAEKAEGEQVGFAASADSQDEQPTLADATEEELIALVEEEPAKGIAVSQELIRRLEATQATRQGSAPASQ